MDENNPTFDSLTSVINLDLSRFSGRAATPVMPRLALIDDDGIYNARSSIVAKRQQIPLSTFISETQFLRSPREDFDIIIIDYFLTSTTGIELASLLKSEQYDQPLILISGNVKPLDLIQETGFSDWMSKEKPIEQILWRAINLYKFSRRNSELKSLIKKVANNVKSNK